MASDFSGPGGRATDNEDVLRAASAVADAKGVHPCAVIPLKIIAESCDPSFQPDAEASALPPKLHRHVIAELTNAAIGMAHDKNVSVTPDDCALVARIALEKCGTAIVDQFNAGKSDAVARADSIVNRILDVFAATEVISCMRSVEGYDQRDLTQIMVQAEAWMCEIAIANSTEDIRFRWPDPVEMVSAYYRSRVSGPVAVQFPHGRTVKAGYFHDPEAFRPTRKAKTPAKSSAADDGNKKSLERTSPEAGALAATLLPFVAQCPAIDRKTGMLIPEGRLVKSLPDGAIVTSWWKKGKLHRDPKEGPAYSQVTNGEQPISILEYRDAGELHRDERDGPAIVNRHADTGVVYFEEYHRHGEVHREHGPSSTSRYPSGNLCAQTWHRNGCLHRDPAEGPAYVHWNEDGTLADQEFWLDGTCVRSTYSESAEVMP